MPNTPISTFSRSDICGAVQNDGAYSRALHRFVIEGRTGRCPGTGDAGEIGRFCRYGGYEMPDSDSLQSCNAGRGFRPKPPAVVRTNGGNRRGRGAVFFLKGTVRMIPERSGGKTEQRSDRAEPARQTRLRRRAVVRKVRIDAAFGKLPFGRFVPMVAGRVKTKGAFV